MSNKPQSVNIAVHLKSRNNYSTLYSQPPLGQAHHLVFNLKTLSLYFQSFFLSKISFLYKIIDYLNVEDKAHRRYSPDQSKTYCNIYAYDLCFLFSLRYKKCYIPRVWWTKHSLDLLKNGETVFPIYNVSVTELNCSQLFTWLEIYGSHFGWHEVNSVDTMQNLVNNYKSIGVIISRNKTRNGHISLVIPEQHSNGRVSLRNQNGITVNPLQTQAGRSNFKYGYINVNSKPWFLNESEYKMYINIS